MSARHHIARRASHTGASANRRSRREEQLFSRYYGPVVMTMLNWPVWEELIEPQERKPEKSLVASAWWMKPAVMLVNRWRRFKERRRAASREFDELFTLEYEAHDESARFFEVHPMLLNFTSEFIDQTRFTIELLGALFIFSARLLWSTPLLRVPELVLIIPAPPMVPLASHRARACPHIPRPPPLR
ncbi:MAG: hypothetical protein IPJ85_17690 [Flavobacteriales bacterium]|nr:hypothetical protein [Flavobacteriales bacterium]